MGPPRSDTSGCGEARHDGSLAGARVVVIGGGGLGSPAALSLAAAGVGHLRIVDDDVVDVSNLQRQTLFRTRDIGRPKAIVAAERLRAISPGIDVEPRTDRLVAANARDLLEDADVVVDGSDNFATKFLLSDACVLMERRLVNAGVRRWLGQALTIWPHRGPCYRCIFEDVPSSGEVPAPATQGLLGALPGVLGAVEAEETLRLLRGEEPRYLGRVLVVDLEAGVFRTVEVRPRTGCPACGESPTITCLDRHRYES